VSLFRRKTTEQQAEEAAAKQARVEELRRKWPHVFDARRREHLEQMTELLAPGEAFEGEFQTAELVMKKDLIFTSRRLLVSLSGTRDVEAIPYRSITSVRTAKFVTHDLVLIVDGRRDRLELQFREQADRDAAVAILNRHEV